MKKWEFYDKETSQKITIYELDANSFNEIKSLYPILDSKYELINSKCIKMKGSNLFYPFPQYIEDTGGEYLSLCTYSHVAANYGSNRNTKKRFIFNKHTKVKLIFFVYGVLVALLMGMIIYQFFKG
jgi:hypothetical protein